jgi:hypothetical protein
MRDATAAARLLRREHGVAPATGSVLGLAFSPDGTELALVAADGQAQVLSTMDWHTVLAESGSYAAGAGMDTGAQPDDGGGRAGVVVLALGGRGGDAQPAVPAVAAAGRAGAEWQARGGGPSAPAPAAVLPGLSWLALGLGDRSVRVVQLPRQRPPPSELPPPRLRPPVQPLPPAPAADEDEHEDEAAAAAAAAAVRRGSLDPSGSRRSETRRDSVPSARSHGSDGSDAAAAAAAAAAVSSPPQHSRATYVALPAAAAAAAAALGGGGGGSRWHHAAEVAAEKFGQPLPLEVTVTKDNETDDVLGLSFNADLLVTRLTAGSPAAKAGVPLGATILAIDGRPVASRLQCATELKRILSGAPPGHAPRRAAAAAAAAHPASFVSRR